MNWLIFLTIIKILCVLVKSYEGEINQIEYYTQLIKDSIQKANLYSARNNNEDFFTKRTDKDEIEEFGTFDFIVVGGGATGSVVATRLTEEESWNVLLLEAGDLDDDIVYIPHTYQMMQNSDRNWGYLTTDQGPYACLGRNNNQCDYTRGKILGGSTALNAYMWNRGNPADYDEWFKQGNPGWSWKSILPLFKKVENYQSNNIDTKYRGFGGPINTDYHEPLNGEEFDEYVKAHEKLGIEFLNDYMAKSQMGVSRIQLNTFRGQRVTASSAYIRPNWKRHNFNVTLKAYVTKVVINSITRKATGVEFVKNGRKYTATAKKEIILSGGAVNTPQLLMLSGIGPCEKLRKLGIKCFQDSPVGERLIDHPSIAIPIKTTKLAKPAIPLNNLVKQYLNGYGPLTNLANIIGITLVNTRDSTSTVPNIQLVPNIDNQVCINVPGRSNFRPEIIQQLLNYSSCSEWGIQIFLLHPKSTGTLELQSSSPKDFPLINTGMLSDEDDVQQMYEGLRLAQKITNLMPYNITYPELPFCSDNKYDSREYWFCVIRYLSYPIYHISGTAKMGPLHDHLAVVDHKLKVYGVKNLRVADCSIIPELNSGHTVAPAYIIGEKASELIKQDHKGPWPLFDVLATEDI